MENLVAGTEDVKFVWNPSLRDLCKISMSSNQEPNDTLTLAA